MQDNDVHASDKDRDATLLANHGNTNIRSGPNNEQERRDAATSLRLAINTQRDENSQIDLSRLEALLLLDRADWDNEVAARRYETPRQTQRLLDRVYPRLLGGGDDPSSAQQNARLAKLVDITDRAERRFAWCQRCVRSLVRVGKGTEDFRLCVFPPGWTRCGRCGDAHEGCRPVSTPAADALRGADLCRFRSPVSTLSTSSSLPASTSSCLRSAPPSAVSSIGKVSMELHQDISRMVQRRAATRPRHGRL